MPTQSPLDQYIKVGPINTRFWTLGKEGSAVVLLRGLGGFIETWIQNVRALAEHHHVCVLDLVGFGRSDKPAAPYSFPYFAQFVRNFMDTQNVERATLCGSLLGGGIALQFALHFPDAIEKLVLLASAGLGKEVYLLFRLATLPLIGELLTRPSRKGTIQLWNEIVHDPAAVSEALIDLSHELGSLPGAQQAMLSTLRASATVRGGRDSALHPILDNLPGIAAPTLIIWGQQDSILPVAHAYVGQERIPNAQLHILDACGHVPQIERPTEVNALVLDFLAS